MKCSRCDYENAETAKFCNNCGHDLRFDSPEANHSKFKAFDDRKLKSKKIVSGSGFEGHNATIGKILAVISISFMIIMSIVAIAFVFCDNQNDSEINSERAVASYERDDANSDILSDNESGFYYPYPFPDKSPSGLK